MKTVLLAFTALIFNIHGYGTEQHRTARPVKTEACR